MRNNNGGQRENSSTSPQGHRLGFLLLPLPLGSIHPNHRILLLGSDSKTPALQPPAQVNAYRLELSQLQTFSVQPKTSKRGEHILPTGVHPSH